MSFCPPPPEIVPSALLRGRKFRNLQAARSVAPAGVDRQFRVRVRQPEASIRIQLRPEELCTCVRRALGRLCRTPRKLRVRARYSLPDPENRAVNLVVISHGSSVQSTRTAKCQLAFRFARLVACGEVTYYSVPARTLRAGRGF